jgi:hypothetical protein
MTNRLKKAELQQEAKAIYINPDKIDQFLQYCLTNKVSLNESKEALISAGFPKVVANRLAELITEDDKSAAHKYRLQQGEEMLQLFKEDMGHPAASMEELEDWAKSQRGRAILDLWKKRQSQDPGKN